MILKKEAIFGKLLLLTLVLVSLAVSCEKTEKFTPEEVETAKNNCRNLIPPPSFKETDGTTIPVSYKALYATSYSSADDPKNINKYFSSLLVSQGWNHKTEDYKSQAFLRFSKDKYSIVVEYSPYVVTSSRIYIVSCYLAAD